MWCTRKSIFRMHGHWKKTTMWGYPDGSRWTPTSISNANVHDLHRFQIPCLCHSTELRRSGLSLSENNPGKWNLDHEARIVQYVIRRLSLGQWPVATSYSVRLCYWIRVQTVRIAGIENFKVTHFCRDDLSYKSSFKINPCISTLAQYYYYLTLFYIYCLYGLFLPNTETWKSYLYVHLLLLRYRYK